MRPTAQLAVPGPATVWVADPGPGIDAVTDRAGRVWRRVPGTTGPSRWQHNGPDGPWQLTWGELLDNHQPLTPA